MSVNFLRLIPDNPEYIPPLALQLQARDMLMCFIPDADEVCVYTTDEVEHIDAGANFEKVACPACGTTLDLEWWMQEMDRTYQETHFADLLVDTPCCQTTQSLNDLCYEAPAGFARFVLEVRNPNGDIDAQQIHQLEAVVQCSLRKIWAHL